MNSLEEYLEYVGEHCQPTMHDEMVWDTLTHDQKISVAKLVRGGVDVMEAAREKAEEEGYEKGYKDGKEEGEETALESQEMTDKLRARLKEIIGVDLRDVVREVLQPLAPNGAAPPPPPAADPGVGP